MNNEPRTPAPRAGPTTTTEPVAGVAGVAFTERDRVRFEEKLDPKGFDHQGIGGPQRTPVTASTAAGVPTNDDADLKDRVCERLAAMGDLDASEVAVTVTDGEVTLRGSVPAQAMSYRCAQTCELVSGVKSIVNHLHVVDPA